MTDLEIQYLRDIVELYHFYCDKHPRTTVVRRDKQEELLSLLKKYHYTDFADAFTLAANTPFLRGEGRRGWMPDFNWLTAKENFEKVIGDHYSEKRGDLVRHGNLWERKIELEILQDMGVVRHLDRKEENEE